MVYAKSGGQTAHQVKQFKVSSFSTIIVCFLAGMEHGPESF